MVFRKAGDRPISGKPLFLLQVVDFEIVQKGTGEFRSGHRDTAFSEPMDAWAIDGPEGWEPTHWAYLPDPELLAVDMPVTAAFLSLPTIMMKQEILGVTVSESMALRYYLYKRKVLGTGLAMSFAKTAGSVVRLLELIESFPPPKNNEDETTEQSF